MSPERSASFEAQPEAIEPQIYVASLSDYNAGILHGTWLPAAVEPAEEWAIHDYEGFGGVRLGEYESLDRLTELAHGIAEHGLAFAAFAEVAGWQGEEDLGESFTERFIGEWASVEAYAEELLDDLGATAAVETMPQWLRSYVQLDVAGFAHDLELGGDISSVRTTVGTVWVFLQ